MTSFTNIYETGYFYGRRKAIVYFAFWILQLGIFISYVSSANTPIRIAILISGQLRSGNMSWESGLIQQDRAWKMFGRDDPPTPIKTQLEFLMKGLLNQNDLYLIDVFIYMQYNPKHESMQQKNVEIANYCDLYRSHTIFQNKSNHIFCKVEVEQDYNDQQAYPFINNLHQWQSYQHGYMKNSKKHQLLHQLYGLWMANTMAKQFVLLPENEEIDYSYTYKIRLRPDIAFTKPISSIHAIPFQSQSNLSVESNCKRTIFFCNDVIYGAGFEDSFNIGLSEDMDRVLDRYLDFTSSPFVFNGYHHYKWWNSESYLQGLLHQRYNICSKPYHEIWIVVIRPLKA